MMEGGREDEKNNFKQSILVFIKLASLAFRAEAERQRQTASQIARTRQKIIAETRAFAKSFAAFKKPLSADDLNRNLSGNDRITTRQGESILISLAENENGSPRPAAQN